MDPSRKELKLRSAQRRAQSTSDRSVIQSTLLDMLEADKFYTHDPHHKEWRSMALRSESLIHLKELTRGDIDRIQSTSFGHIQ